jgi:hypothetical protein
MDTLALMFAEEYLLWLSLGAAGLFKTEVGLELVAFTEIPLFLSLLEVVLKFC